MQIFQRNILRKYTESLNPDQIEKSYRQFTNYFLNPERQENIKNSKEEQFQEGFLRELFVNILGYVLNPDPNFNLITEKKNETNSKKADGAILVDGKVVGVIELKDHKTTDLSKVEAQAFNYKSQHKEAVYVVISNFEKLRFFIDNAVDFEEFDLFHLTKDDFARLWICLAYENIAKNLPKQIKAASLNNEDQVTNALYKDYSNFKRNLFEDILKNNPTDNTEHKILLFKKTQKLLDRLLFIFFAEDRDLLPPNSIMLIIEQWEKLKELDEYQSLYSRLKKYFGYMNTGFKGKNYEVFAYNGGLFKPDEILDNLIISDEVFIKYCKKLSDYDFASDVDVNILGHIFENSLTEIEEITTKLQQGQAPTISKRKKDGVFYTPQYITKYIVENTVGKLCKEKKTELGIDESEYFTDKKRQLSTKKDLIQKLEAYRDWLLQISICDPACGSGAFLNAALDFLMAEHKLIDEMQAKVAGESIVFPNIESSILENNLYGVDINEESVEIAKLSLWLRTAKPYRKLSSLNNNIKCGNSLIDDPEIASEKAFCWEKEFPNVFEKGGFDVVIGNPPYLRVQGLRENYELESNFYESNYKSATERFDFYVLFMERGFALINSSGKMSFILPHKFINASFGIGLRKYLYDNKAIESIVHFGAEQVFEEASVYTCITTLSYNNDSFLFSKAIPKEINENVSFEEHLLSELSDVEKWTLSQKDDSQILKKLKENPLRVKDIFKGVFQGIVSGDNKAFYLINCTLHEDYIDGLSQLSNERIKIEKAICKPIFTGKTISRYRIKNHGEYLIFPYQLVNGKTTFYTEDELKNLFPLCFDYFISIKQRLESRGTESMKYPIWYALWNARSILNLESKKILTPDVCFGGSMVYDDLGCYHNDTSYGLILKEPSDMKYKAYLAILNSRITWYFLNKTGTELRGGFFRFKTKYLEPFPIPNLSEQNFEEFSALADYMQNLYKALNQKRHRFIHRLQESIGVQKITAALERFDEADFKTLLAELKKQKIRLSFTQQDNLEDYFNQYKVDCNALSAQIAATDKQIDQIVYQLYGLTEDEIKIVEGE